MCADEVEQLLSCGNEIIKHDPTLETGRPASPEDRVGGPLRRAGRLTAGRRPSRFPPFYGGRVTLRLVAIDLEVFGVLHPLKIPAVPAMGTLVEVEEGLPQHFHLFLPCGCSSCLTSGQPTTPRAAKQVG